VSEAEKYITAASGDTAVIVVKCCACRRVREDGHWLFPQNIPERNSIYSHTYCPACLKDAYATLDVLEVCAG